MKQLSDPKFIKSNSMGISGIKDYPGQNISKLKISRTDANLVSLKRYLDKDANLVIEFDHFMTHKEIHSFEKSSNKGVCVKCTNIESIVYEDAAKEEFALPAAAASAMPESHSSVAMLGEEDAGTPSDLE